MSTITISETRNLFNPNNLTFNEREKDLEAQKNVETERVKRDKSSPFSRWTQYNNECTKEMIWLAMKHPTAHAILLFLVDQMDNLNAVMCSYKVLQEVLGITKDTVRRSMKVLKDNGYVAVLKSGASNIYTINDSIYWKSYSHRKKYSKFPVNTVLALSEQEKSYQLSFSDLEVAKHKEVTSRKGQKEK